MTSLRSLWRPLLLVFSGMMLHGSVVAQILGEYKGKINVLTPAWSTMIGADLIGIGGSGVAREGLSSSALVNPAGAWTSKPRADVGGWWRPSAPGIFGYSYTQATFLPSYGSITLPMEPFSIQFGIARTHDQKFSSGEIGITTEASPEIPIGYTRSVLFGSVHTAFASISAPIGLHFVYGMTVGVDHIDFWRTYYTTWYHMIGTGWRLTAGGIFNLSSDITFGAVLKYVVPIDLASRNNIAPPRVPGRVPVGIGERFVAHSPMEFEIGTAIRLSPQVCLMLSTQYEQWTTAFSDGRDLWQLRVGIEAQVMDPMIVRLGTFTQQEPLSERRGYLDQQFVSLGLRLNLTDRVGLDLAYSTSSPFTRSDVEFGTIRFDRSFHRSELVGGISVAL